MTSAADKLIDELLERYLSLLDQYTTLREELAQVQQSVFQSLARANFTSDRGVRYGQDQYDERMQASRRVAITRADEAAPPVFAVAEEQPPAPTTAGDAKEDKNDEVKVDSGEKGGEETEAEAEVGEKKAAATAATAAKNPIRWFGVLVPQALREAQSQSIKVAEDIIPRLVSVEAEMAHVEIEVRRARKKRAKATEADKKKETAPSAPAVAASS